MLRICLYTSSILLCFVSSSRPALANANSDGTSAATNLSAPAATAPSPSSTPNSVRTTQTTDLLSSQGTPASSQGYTAAPQGSSGSSAVPSVPDASASHKFYTISVALREIYDNNIFTATTGRQASFETQVSPSILFDFPRENSDFSLRETFTATYYTNRSEAFDFTNEVVAQFQHSFSDRFSINAAEQLRYYTEPSLFENTGTLYYSGAYIANTFNGSFNAQWTPLVSTLLTYANTVVDYMNSSVGAGQDSVENTGSATLGFAILPKINLNFGGIIDDISYNDIARGYTSFTGNTGINWAALPTLSVNLAVGGSVTQTELGGSTPSPYGAVSLNWQIGARSSFTFNYSHSVVPTDVTTAQGQIADRIGTTFRYDILPSLSAHLEGTYTYGQYTGWLLSPNTTTAFSENDFAIDAGLTYHINTHFDVNLGNIYSGVASGLSFRDYNRDQIYLGVRGTY